MAWTEEASAVDEVFHPRNDDPWWNEASYVSFRIPERHSAAGGKQHEASWPATSAIDA
jgi:hypothetical protein